MLGSEHAHGRSDMSDLSPSTQQEERLPLVSATAHLDRRLAGGGDAWLPAPQRQHGKGRAMHADHAGSGSSPHGHSRHSLQAGAVGRKRGAGSDAGDVLSLAGPVEAGPPAWPPPPPGAWPNAHKLQPAAILPPDHDAKQLKPNCSVCWGCNTQLVEIGKETVRAPVLSAQCSLQREGAVTLT